VNQEQSFNLFSNLINEQLEKENRYLRAQMEWIHGRLLKIPRPDDAQRAALARLARELDPQRFAQTFNFFTPATLLPWWRRLIAQKRDYSHRRLRVGRPRTSKEMELLVIRLAMGRGGQFCPAFRRSYGKPGWNPRHCRLKAPT
jgi:hypothetical protein